MNNSERPEIPEEKIIQVNNALKIDFSKPYKFIYFDWWFHLLTYPVYAACWIFARLCSLFFSFRVKNKRKIRTYLRKSGCILVSNHCHYFDTVLASCVLQPRRLYVSVVQRNFEVPYVRRLLRFLRAFPIPSHPAGFKMITEPIGQALERGHHVLFLPEGNLLHLSQTIHKFRPGAFHQAYIHQVPVIPMVYVLKRRTFLGKKMPPNWIKMTCVFGDPVYPPPLNKDGSFPKEELKKITSRTAGWMDETLAVSHGRSTGTAT